VQSWKDGSRYPMQVMKYQQYQMMQSVLRHLEGGRVQRRAKPRKGQACEGKEERAVGGLQKRRKRRRQGSWTCLP